jgi:hypothetical protein
MKEKPRAKRASSTQFEQIPVAVVKRIAHMSRFTKPANLVVQPPSEKREPYSVSTNRLVRSSGS